MKALKYLGLFFFYPLCMMTIGFVGGIAVMNYFYPARSADYYMSRDWYGAASQKDQTAGQNSEEVSKEQGTEQNGADTETEQSPVSGSGLGNQTAGDGEGAGTDSPVVNGEAALPQSAQTVGVLAAEQTIGINTLYILREVDLVKRVTVETVLQLPQEYIGMTREDFLLSLEAYQADPPAEETERGFVGVSVLSFSGEKVTVEKSYRKTEPVRSFYLVVEDNLVVVYESDRQTLYMDTDILLTELPEELQQEIIKAMYLPDEESLFDFLENYSS